MKHHHTYQYYHTCCLLCIILIVSSFFSPSLSYDSSMMFTSLKVSINQNALKAKSIRQSQRFLTTHIAIEEKAEKKQETFWQKLGSPKFISAPMVDQSELAFRLLVRANGADLAFTQMLNSKIFSQDANYRREYCDWLDYRKGSTSKEDGDREEDYAKKYDRPLIVQFNGNDPQTLVKAGRFVDETVSAIDLNLGCPQNIARKGNYGAHLLNTKDKTIIFNVVKAMVNDLRCPVTVKIRKLSTGNDEDTVRFCQQLEDCGVSMITIHGRVMEQSKLFMGPADWDIIKRVKAAVKSIPIVANGGIHTYDDIIHCLAYTNADGVMSSEALLSNPKLFNVANKIEYEQNFIANQLRTTDEYLSLVQRYPPPHPLESVVRGHLFRMLHRFIHARKNDDVRQQLATGDVLQMVQAVELLKDRCHKYSREGGIGSFEQAKLDGYCIETSWYLRHRDEKAQQRKLTIPRGGLPYESGKNHGNHPSHRITVGLR